MAQAEINIDDFVNYESEYRSYVKKAHVSGGCLTGLCPFHEDKNNSFSVDLKTGMWHCFSEDIAGNFLDFYARIHSTSTKEAYKAILDKYREKRIDGPDQKIAISHGDCLEDARLLADGVREITPGVDITIASHEPFSGAHVGPGMLALFFRGTER